MAILKPTAQRVTSTVLCGAVAFLAFISIFVAWSDVDSASGTNLSLRCTETIECGKSFDYNDWVHSLSDQCTSTNKITGLLIASAVCVACGLLSYWSRFLECPARGCFKQWTDCGKLLTILFFLVIAGIFSVVLLQSFQNGCIVRLDGTVFDLASSHFNATSNATELATSVHVADAGYSGGYYIVIAACVFVFSASLFEITGGWSTDQCWGFPPAIRRFCGFVCTCLALFFFVYSIFIEWGHVDIGQSDCSRGGEATPAKCDSYYSLTLFSVTLCSQFDYTDRMSSCDSAGSTVLGLVITTIVIAVCAAILSQVRLWAEDKGKCLHILLRMSVGVCCVVCAALLIAAGIHWQQKCEDKLHADVSAGLMMNYIAAALSVMVLVFESTGWCDCCYMQQQVQPVRLQ